MEFSIIIPFYNGERFILNLLKSIEKSYLLESNIFELDIIIVIDSPLTEVNLLNNLLCDNLGLDFKSKISLFKNNMNIGVAESRNKGLELSKGSYITFIDQDDTIDVSYFIEMAFVLNSSNVNIYILNGYYIHLKSNKKVPLFFIKPTLRLNVFLRQNKILTTGLIVFKRNFLVENKLKFFDTDLSYKGCDDWFLYLSIINSIEFDYTFIDKHIYNYSFHDSNYSNNIKEAILASISTIEYFSLQSTNSKKYMFCNAIKRLNFEMLIYVDKIGFIKSLLINPLGFLHFLSSRITDYNRIAGFIYRKTIKMPFRV